MADIFRKTNFLLLLFVLAVLTTSGCIGGTTSGSAGGQGLVIETFKTTSDSIESGESVGLQLEVRNMGGYNGQTGIGVPAIAEIMSIDPNEWMVTPATIVDLGTLLIPDTESQTPGGLAKATWELVAPRLERGITKPYALRARVYYPYETTVVRPVWFVTSEELRRIVQLGNALESQSQTQTSGPLTVTINAGNFVKAQDFRTSKFQLQIRIDNTGSGEIRGKDYPVAISVEWPQWVSPIGGYCPQQTQWTVPLYTDIPAGLPQPAGTFIKMWNGKTTDMTCEFQIVQPPSSRTAGDFKVKLGYIYSTDSSTQVTVKGMEEF